MKAQLLKEGVGEGITFISSRLDSTVVHKVNCFKIDGASKWDREGVPSSDTEVRHLFFHSKDRFHQESA